jgi:hypothetical protein
MSGPDIRPILAVVSNVPVPAIGECWERTFVLAILEAVRSKACDGRIMQEAEIFAQGSSLYGSRKCKQPVPH